MALQQWAVDGLGGFMAVDQLSKKLRYRAQQETRLVPFCDEIDGFGKGKGDTVKFTRAGNLNSAGGVNGITEGAKMPETDITLTQGSVVVLEYGYCVAA